MNAANRFNDKPALGVLNENTLRASRLGVVKTVSHAPKKVAGYDEESSAAR